MVNWFVAYFDFVRYGEEYIIYFFNYSVVLYTDGLMLSKIMEQTKTGYQRVFSADEPNRLETATGGNHTSREPTG